MKITRFIYLYISLTVVLAFFLAVNYKDHNSQDVQGLSTDTKIHGIILPHHEVAQELIINALDTVSINRNYKNIILISPNHFYPESYTFTTNNNSIRLFNKSFDIQSEFPHIIIDSDRVEKEHGVQSVLKYVKTYYPEANYHVLITSLKYDQIELQKMAKYLSTYQDDTLFVLSADFAHGYLQEKALLNNQESIQSIKNFEYQRILGYDDANMDTPVGTALFLMIMDKIGSKNWTLLHNSHSAILKQDPAIQGTGYVIGVFTN